MLDFGIRDPLSTNAAVFDFSSLLAYGFSVATASITVTVLTGIDPLPQNILYTPAIVEGHQVLQALANGVPGTIYQLTCSAVAAEGTFVLTGYVAFTSTPL